MRTNVRRGGFLVACLAAIGLLTGCLPASQAGEPATATHWPTAVLTGVVRVSEPEELLPSDGRLSDWRLRNVCADGDVLLATVGEGNQTKVVAVNLRSGKIAGLDGPFIASGQWRTSERYFAWTASDAPDDPIERLHVYDTHTGEEFVVEGEGGSQCCPYVSGDMVVWSEIHGDRSWDIYAYDMSFRELIPIVTRPLIQGRPKIEDNWMIYLENKGGDPHNMMRDLYLHNLTTSEDMLIGPSPYASRLDGGTYGIDNGRVVWKGWNIAQEPTREGPLPTLHVYDSQSRTEHIIDTSSTCVPIDFQMAGDLILFGCEDGFHGYDLAQRIFFDVPYPEHSIGYVYLSETHVVFRIQEKSPTVWDYLTPGASPMPPREYWLTPQPARFRLFVAPITR